MTLVNIDSGGMRLNVADIRLRDVVTEQVKRLSPLARERGIELSCLIRDPCETVGDSLKLQQVFYNVIDNAIKYTPRGGEVRVELARAGKRAVVRVEDTGIGIPAADLPHIFDRFYRVDKARSRETGGTGPGLSIVRQIVLLHDGDIRAESEENKAPRSSLSFPSSQNSGGAAAGKRVRPLKRAFALIWRSSFLPGALAEETLPEPEEEAPQMLLGEAAAEYFYEVTLHYAASDGISLSPATRTLLVQSGETLLDVVLETLLEPTGGPAQVSVVPGDTRVISREVSGALVTVDLSIDARNVQSEQELLRMYLAIAGTLLELEGVEGVNVLIGGREEGLLGLPCGVFTGVGEDVATVWAQMQAEADRYLGDAQGSVTRVAALYFPSEDGNWLVPETREVTFGEDGCARALVDALCAGPAALSCARALSPTGTLLAGDPALTVTGEGERVLQLNLSGEALAAAEAGGVQMWQVCGALTLTLCSF